VHLTHALHADVRRSLKQSCGNPEVVDYLLQLPSRVELFHQLKQLNFTWVYVQAPLAPPEEIKRKIAL
jgi:hypothetical protein